MWTAFYCHVLFPALSRQFGMTHPNRDFRIIHPAELLLET